MTLKQSDFQLEHHFLDRAVMEHTEGERLVAMVEPHLVADRIALETCRGMVRHFGVKNPITWAMLERILTHGKEDADDMHDLLVSHEGHATLEH